MPLVVSCGSPLRQDRHLPIGLRALPSPESSLPFASAPGTALRTPSMHFAINLAARRIFDRSGGWTTPVPVRLWCWHSCWRGACYSFPGIFGEMRRLDAEATAAGKIDSSAAEHSLEKERTAGCGGDISLRLKSSSGRPTAG
ncbi:MAG: hypothetical protein MZV70_41185 [Desulfobacterales bacterium]|nr:hypothetical protein [Desulfobacterales bacterium]